MVEFVMENKITTYERRVYNVYEFIGDIGGINQIILSLLTFFMNFFSNKVYQFSASSDFYKNKISSNLNLEKEENPQNMDKLSDNSHQQKPTMQNIFSKIKQHGVKKTQSHLKIEENHVNLPHNLMQEEAKSMKAIKNLDKNVLAKNDI